MALRCARRGASGPKLNLVGFRVSGAQAGTASNFPRLAPGGRGRWQNQAREGPLRDERNPREPIQLGQRWAHVQSTSGSLGGRERPILWIVKICAYRLPVRSPIRKVVWQSGAIGSTSSFIADQDGAHLHC